MGPGAIAKILVTDNDVTQKKLAQAVGVSPAKLSNYLTEKNEMPCHVLAGVAQYFQVSADYLLGLTDIDPSDEARKQRQRLTEEEQNEMHRYEEYLLWKRKK